MLVEVRLPFLPADTRFGFYEFNRRAGDFALAMALVTYRVEDGMISAARVAVGGVEPQPRRIAQAEQALVGQSAGPRRRSRPRPRRSPRPSIRSTMPPPAHPIAAIWSHTVDAPRARTGGGMSEKREITLTINGRSYGVRSTRVVRWSMPSATIADRPGRISAASTAFAAPAPFWSTANRSARA